MCIYIYIYDVYAYVYIYICIYTHTYTERGDAPRLAALPGADAGDLSIVKYSIV